VRGDVSQVVHQRHRLRRSDLLQVADLVAGGPAASLRGHADLHRHSERDDMRGVLRGLRVVSLPRVRGDGRRQLHRIERSVLVRRVRRGRGMRYRLLSRVQHLGGRRVVQRDPVLCRVRRMRGRVR
jgi:hypothetical protein